MLTIRNIDKIHDKQITEKWEVYEVIEAPTQYQIVLTNVGQYKMYHWSFGLQRNKDQALNRYQLKTNVDGKDYDFWLKGSDITPIGIIEYIHTIIGKTEIDANNT
jgi:hypothetical protein